MHERREKKEKEASCSWHSNVRQGARRGNSLQKIREDTARKPESRIYHEKSIFSFNLLTSS